MIKVDIYEDDQGKIREYRVAGHADSNPEGFDEVCAMVSLTTQVPVLGMEQVLSRTLDYSVDEEDGLLCVRLVDAPDDKTEVLLRTMVLGLKGIQKTYSDYLAIEEHRR